MVRLYFLPLTENKLDGLCGRPDHCHIRYRTPSSTEKKHSPLPRLPFDAHAASHAAFMLAQSMQWPDLMPANWPDGRVAQTNATCHCPREAAFLPRERRQLHTRLNTPPCRIQTATDCLPPSIKPTGAPRNLPRPHVHSRDVCH